MADGRKVGRLTALAVTKARAKGMYGDGGGLYLHVSASGAKSWIYRFMLAKKPREMGLGPTHTISLAEARDMALECRKLRRENVDPIEARKARRNADRLDAAKAMTFRQCAESYIAAHKAGWRNHKHAAQWSATLAAYAYPVFGSLAVHAVDTSLVTKAIEPVWNVKPETASRVRGRVESILDWATARGYRAGENPARWRGHLDKLLPQKSKVRRVEHHAALAYAEIAGFIGELRRQEGIAARALGFAILTAARTGEVIGACWREIDFGERLWTVPGERMKAAREHRVPLSKAALAILEALRPPSEADQTGFIFPGARTGRSLSNMALLMTLRRMGRSDLTAHGFRSTFRDWAAERTTFPTEVAEMALAHTVSDKVEAAYRRGDLFEKRRRVMDAWAGYCTSNPGAGGVVPLRRHA